MSNYLLNLVFKDCESKGWNVIGKNNDSTTYLLYLTDHYQTAYVYLYKNTLTFGVTTFTSTTGEVVLAAYNSIDECLEHILEMEK